MFTVSLKKLALGFWWQLLLFPALEVSRSAGLVVPYLFLLLCICYWGCYFTALLSFLPCGQFWQLHILLCCWWCPYCASHWWSSATGGTPEDAWCSFCTISAAGRGAGSYSYVSSSALLSSPSHQALVVAGSPGDVPAERRAWLLIHGIVPPCCHPSF